MNRWRLLLVGFCFTLLVACGERANSAEIPPTPTFVEKIIYVAPHTESCGDDRRQCFLARGSNADEWQLLTDSLTGFTYEEGYTYKLQIRADSAESSEWALVEILGQEGSFKSDRPESAEEQLQIWHLDFMLTNAIALDNDITMTFGDRRIQGSGGCNDYTAAYRVDGESALTVEAINANKQLCDELVSQQERDYFDALSVVANYEQPDGATLIFHDAQGMPVLTFVTSR